MSIREATVLGKLFATGLMLTTGIAPINIDPAAVLVRHMSVRDKVGQLFVVEVHGRDAQAVSPGNRALYGVDTPAQVIEKYRPGGVIYFDARRGPDNVGAPRQIATLSNGLQAAALRTGAHVPLLISTDQEGG